MKTVQISQIIEDTGEKSRTIQNWTDLGILHAEANTDRRGRGTHRVYRAEPFHGERMWALFASALYKLRMPLRDIKDFIDALRVMIDPLEYADKNYPDFEAAMRMRERFVEGEARCNPFHASILGDDRWLLLLSTIDADADTRFKIQYVSQWFAVRDSDEGRMLNRFFEENPVSTVINLHQVLAPLRHETTGLDDDLREIGPNRIKEVMGLADEGGADG